MKTRTVFWITVAWTAYSLFLFSISGQSLIERGVQLEREEVYTYLFNSIFVGLFAGIIGGSGIVFLWSNWLRTKPYGKALLSILLSYSLIYLFVSIISGLLFYTSDAATTSWLSKFEWIVAGIFSLESIIGFVAWLIIVIITMITLLVNDKYGPGVFKNFLLGKYFHPHREERIFMFLDLRSSTTIAEQLGEERYFAFIREVFEHVTPVILNHEGEVYQYVGDEIVISWLIKSGMKNTNCIECFFQIQHLLDSKTDYYIKEYNIKPVFKAGVHLGTVMAGEIGVVKREISYSGDVLNTTARIQSKCNEFQTELLVSKDLIDNISASISTLNLKEIGAIELKGKKEKVTLYTIENCK